MPVSSLKKEKAPRDWRDALKSFKFSGGPMLAVLSLALATIVVELPRYRNESFRVEAHYAFGVSKRALVLRDFGTFAKLDYIDAGVVGTRIVTHDLADCPRVAELLSVTFGPPAFVKHDRLSDGTPVIVPDGPTFVAEAAASHAKIIGGEKGEGGLLTEFGRWATAAIDAAGACPAD